MSVCKQAETASELNKPEQQRKDSLFSVFIRKINELTSFVTFTLPVGEPVKKGPQTVLGLDPKVEKTSLDCSWKWMATEKGRITLSPSFK